MVVGEASINNIMGGIENTGSVRLHNHKRKLKQRFDIIKKLGQGTYGKVQLGINKETGQEVAIKTIKKSKIETEADLIRIRREIQIMSSVQHPNIIHIYEVFENREKMVLVMEYAAGGELYDYLSERKVLPEEEARRIFRQISTACYYCHKHKICHRDLKLENILLDENKNAKIADFGLSNVFDDHRLLSTFCGSPLYASPEIVKGTPYHGPEADCWSLGVLLYTLVYGAMPFDGSNFKRLVKQISQGDYFEPKNPSPASPLIQEMLTVNAKNRANIEKICAHWWVNEGYEESCLDISEDLANQTPVRLDVLLSLNPPPPQLESDQLVVAGEANDEQMKAEPAVPTRSQSAGSLMDISNPAEKRIKEMISSEVKPPPPKRKLETTVSTEQANVSQGGKRKEKITKERTIADISVSGQEEQEQQIEDVKMNELPVKNGNDVAQVDDDPNLQGAACVELLEEAKKKQAPKVKKTMSTSVSNKILEEINENPSQESLHHDKENQLKTQETTTPTRKSEESEKEKDVKTPVKKKIIKKKVLSDKNEVVKPEVEKKEEEKKKEEVPAEPPTKPVERRQSRIFEQAEKFQSMIQDNKAPNASPEKPKKIIIPGVSVGGFKKEFERKASLKNVSPPKIKTALSKKHVIEDKGTPVPEPQEQKSADVPPPVSSTPAVEVPKPTPLSTDEEKKIEKVADVEKKVVMMPQEEKKKEEENKEDAERKLKMKNAVNIISNALDKEGARKSKSRPCMTRKPPVPFGASGRSASGSIAMISSPMSPPADKQRFLKMQPILPLSSTPEQVKEVPAEPAQPENQTSSAEITLKSATLPRRKSTKAEIQLDYPKPKPAQMEFKTEMAHQVQAPPPALSTQRSEVMFPVNTPPMNVGLRSSSLEPDNRSRERIIPIAFEKTQEQPRESLQSPPTKPPVPRVFQTQKSASTQRSNSLSRQSTQESDSENTVSGDPIKKSPREYIIPIAVEGGGYVTPRAGSLEPSDTSSTVTNSSRKTTSSKFSRPRRMVSIFDRDASEDESPFGTLHRHHSFGKDSDTEGDSRKDSFHMHRLRSSRPRKTTLEHNDSLSSGEDDDDEDGFEFLTAENLFSTLLSRVRGLTQRINTDDNPRAAFPNSRLLSHFDHGNFWNRMEPLGSRNSPLGRQFSRERSVSNSSSSATPWRRSVSRDLASDIDSVFTDRRTPMHTATLPRGDNLEEDRKENLNLSDLNLKKLKLTEEDALALSYLTPGLSRRIQKQLFASLPPSEARKISRTLSMREEQKNPSTITEERRSVDRISRLNSSEERIGSSNSTTTLPRRFSYGYSLTPTTNSLTALDTNQRCSKLQQKIPESGNTRKISRFLRPDFYDQPKESTTFEKEKKERELETQKVLKEIRDKRIKNRISMRRERSMSREKSEDGDEKMIKCKDLVEALTSSTGRGRKLKDEDDSILRQEEESRISSNRDNDNLQKLREQEGSNIRQNRIDEDARYSRLRGDEGVRRVKPEEDVKAKGREDSYTSRLFQHRAKQERALEDRNEAKTNEDLNDNGLISSLNKNKPLKDSVDSNKTIENLLLGTKSPLEENKTFEQESFGLKSNLDESKTTGNPFYGLKSPLEEHKSVGHNLKSSLDENKTIKTNGNNSSTENKNIDDSINEENKLRDTESLLKNVSDNIKNIESNVLSNSQRVGAVKKDRVSKLIRPKSYPSENGGGRKSGQTSPTEHESSDKSSVDTSAKIVGVVKKGIKSKENGDAIPKLKQNGEVNGGKVKDTADSNIGKLNQVSDMCAESSNQVRKLTGIKDKSSSVDVEASEVKAVKRLSLPEGKLSEDAQQEKSKLVKLKSKISKSSKSTSENGSIKKVSSKLPEKSEYAEKSVLVSENIKTTSDTNINSKIINTISSGAKYLKTSQSMELKSEKLDRSVSSKCNSNEKLEKTLITGKISPTKIFNKSSENLDLVNGNYIPDSSSTESPVTDINENIGKPSKKADFFKTVYSELNSTRKDLKTKKSQIDDSVNERKSDKSIDSKNENTLVKTVGKNKNSTKAANIESDTNNSQNHPEEASSSKSKELKLKKSTTQPAQSTTGKNKFLQSIEKKIEKLRSFSAEEKAAKPGGVETTIKRLREQSVPRNMDHITESTLIKRAVSVEDFSNVKSKALQPSRKSVTKILGLFKKYEDKSPKSPENIDPITMLDNIRESNIPMMKGKEKERPKSLQVNKTSKLPVNAHRKSLSLEGREVNLERNEESYTRRKSLGLEGKEDVKSPNLEAREDARSQRKMLSVEGSSTNLERKEDVKKKLNLEDSLLQRRSFSMEGKDDAKVKRKSLEERDEAIQQRISLISPESKRTEYISSSEETRKKLEGRNNLDSHRNSENINGEKKNGNTEYEHENQNNYLEENESQRKIYGNSEESRSGKTYAQRKTSNYSNNNENNKKTERKNLKLDFSSSAQDLNLNRISYATDDNSTLLSPFDETTSCDSWSVCSDFHHTQDLSSPLSPNGNTYSGDENDSVIDRIRRKSFYTRFNEKPKSKTRKSLIGNYKDLDLYKDYKEKSLPRYKDYSGSRRSSGYSASSGEIESEYRPYVRSKSVSGGGEYSGGIPHRYQTYNPRKSNMSSFYGNEDGITEELNTTGLYKKYTSRLGSLSRASRSPSSDFQYIPHSHATSSSSSTHQYHHHQTTENGHTEHAV